MEKELEELVNNRKQLIEIHKKNKFTNGIHNLLTDMYPDTAHFIYELLQNAEDMNATEVYFHLYSDGIDFEHNGTKRNFNIKDIDAITNIGNNPQKKDDVTSIGKFGVGFKAVFAYTATPEIHSGQYHFRIRDYFVPEFDNVEHVSVIDENGVSWTKFRFPFNNPAKSSRKAYAEVLEGLTELNAYSVLFLENIKRIEYQIDDDDIRIIEKENKENHIYRITFYDNEDEQYYYSEWLCFIKPIDIIDEQGYSKSLHAAIAYAIDYDDNANNYEIVEVDEIGKTFIYFPAEKEYSGLRFYINAPFASTVARDSIRDCRENAELMNAIAEIVVESLFYIKDIGRLNYNFLKVLPNNYDDIKNPFAVIRSAIFNAFEENKLFPINENTYVSSSEVVICDNDIAKLFPDKKEFELISGLDKYLYVLLNNNRANTFINNIINIKFYNEEFGKIFLDYPSQLVALMKRKSDDWLNDFYKRILKNFKSYNDRGSYTYNDYIRFKNILKNTAIIKGNDDNFYKPDDIFILRSGVNLIDNDTVIVKPFFVNDCETEELFKRLDVKAYGPKIIAERIISKYNINSFDVDEEQYYKDLLSLARYDSKTYGSIDVFNCYLFKSNNDSLLHKASELYFGKHYGNSNGEILASKLNADTLCNSYLDKYTESEIVDILQFVKRCGIKKDLEIVKIDVYDNPDFGTMLWTDGRKTDGGTNVDYTIPFITKLLEMRDKEISCIIWNFLYSQKTNIYRQAKYSPNAKANNKTCDSMLVQYLKKYDWIPDKEGVFHKPQDITEDELPDNFMKNNNNAFDNSVLSFIDFGKSASVESNEEAQAIKFAEKHDSSIISNARLRELEEKEAMYDKLENKRKNSDKNSVDSVDELYAAQTKKQKKNINDGDDFTGSGAVNNKEKRERNITATFKEKSSEKGSVQRKLFSKIVESNKEEKLTLKNWYNGHCQMCDRFIIGWNGEMHFEARNIIITSHLDNEIRNTLGLAWNSLCLCPFCAAKFEVCSRNMEDMPEQLRKQEIYNGDDERIIITMELAEERQEISFVPKHFLALQKGLQLLDEYLKKNSEI